MHLINAPVAKEHNILNAVQTAHAKTVAWTFKDYDNNYGRHPADTSASLVSTFTYIIIYLLRSECEHCVLIYLGTQKIQQLVMRCNIDIVKIFAKNVSIFDIG